MLTAHHLKVLNFCKNVIHHHFLTKFVTTLFCINNTQKKLQIPIIFINHLTLMLKKLALYKGYCKYLCLCDDFEATNADNLQMEIREIVKTK